MDGGPIAGDGSLAQALRRTFGGGLTLVTGTDTDIGKTMVTAAIVRTLLEAGAMPIAVKIAQTGLRSDEPGDVDEVARLCGLAGGTTREFSRCTEALAPTTAARREGVQLPSMARVASLLSGLMALQQGAPVVAEGAGGIMVGLDNEGHGLLELIPLLARQGVSARVIVVARPGLGTLNHAQLTCSAIRDHGGTVAGLVLGWYPSDPDLATLCNREEIPSLCGTHLLGALPEHLGQLTPRAFADAVRAA
ncbi:dethiobiotin synthase [Propionibacterium freudenreichii]|uniref:dethiobiotin synthase n=1 Tax=Propionibacterium freudenreichii TaxID=1744 RepID=UPI00254C4C1A|nr:dethiobiotin synthase [Propionibacterium freudenreichii]MDK9360383.1 dethiobiotin synthase [Propionibacterium freudenreichii]MDK9659949.1 dethiobiotin synthase [Propionibacterium freudenreichii]